MVPWQEKLRRNQLDKRAKQTILTPRSALIPLDSNNGPESPPVLFDKEIEEDGERCRHCHSTKLITDWKQGDRVCTNCGVVAEGHLLDDRPEWKDFNDAEDIVKRGCTSVGGSARSGLVPVDESKYLGGLQPTTLSKHPFGGTTNGGYGLARIQKRLRATNRKLDTLMEKAHNDALKDAKINRIIRLRRGNDTEIEYEKFLPQEEEDIHRMHTALHADKWSLDRAILLHGGAHDHTSNDDQIEEREELITRLDTRLKKASKDLYTAYRLITEAAQRLHLPDKVTNEAVHRLVKIVTRRDGLNVKGVSNRIIKADTNQTVAERKLASERVKEYNTLRQIGSLGAAIIFVTSRGMGFTRSLAKVCTSFQHDIEWVKDSSFIKPKHCSRGINEIKAIFPEYLYTFSPNNNNHSMSSSDDAPIIQMNDSLSTANFADNFLQPLKLPPVAEASIKTLLVHCREEQVEMGIHSGKKLSTLCAALCFFICSTGSIMQRLALQVEPQTDDGKTKKRQRQLLLSRGGMNDDSNNSTTSNEDGAFFKKQKTNGMVDTNDNDCHPFDVFSHAPIVEDQSKKQEYEMRRMWDMWREQMPWSRTAIEIEQKCGISRHTLLDFYKSHLFPKRETLLALLKDMATSKMNVNRNCTTLQETPLASTLLSHVLSAAGLMEK